LARMDEAPPEAFVCPLTREVMVDPVISLGDSLSYERAAWLARPAPAGAVTTAAVPNIALKQAIAAWREGIRWSHGEVMGTGEQPWSLPPCHMCQALFPLSSAQDRLRKQETVFVWRYRVPSRRRCSRRRW
jgi:hypothetical protein